MNIFVTGGAGYIGSVCVELLCDLGHQVTVFDNLSEGHREAVDPRARWVEGDLAERERLLAEVGNAGTEAIIHFAANALVGESMANPSKYFRNNVASALNLADAAVAARVRKLVFSSTCATYGPPDRVPIDESMPQQPINPYGESKLMFEKILKWYHQLHGLEYVAFRFFNAGGASERYGEDHRVETHLIPNVLKVALGQKPYIAILGTDYPTADGTCVRDYIHIEDLAEAHRLALAPGIIGNFNLGNSVGFSVREVIATCERISGVSIPVIEQPPRPADPPSLIASAEKARRELGWVPKYPQLDEIIRTAWEWHRKHPHGYGSSGTA